MALTGPLTPAVPLPHVTAPASAAAPLVQAGADHHVVAVAQGRHAVVADLVIRRTADQAVRGTDGTADAGRAAAPRDRAARRRAVVPVGAAHHVVAVAQGRHAADVAPTGSSAVLPTRLFVALTAPLTPAVPLPHVTAPAEAAAPLVQLGLLTT